MKCFLKTILTYTILYVGGPSMELKFALKCGVGYLY